MSQEHDSAVLFGCFEQLSSDAEQMNYTLLTPQIHDSRPRGQQVAAQLCQRSSMYLQSRMDRSLSLSSQQPSSPSTSRPSPLSKMLAHASAVFLSVLATSAVMVAASPAPWGNPTTTPAITTTVTVTAPATTSTAPASQCNTGPVQCCNSVQSASSSSASDLLGLLGIVLQDVNALVGIDCTPISVIGAGSGAHCNAEPVCCENNNFNGLISLGCSPVNINL
ncbi:hypothetical protein EVG20_g6047 [Dentipellis fragilis]|uniref:Hydrophobin n=1 Tax=Dentipellis fragilis TaxID=205917 RepID=A0A4Y9YNG9_9AGAM|nr:hypothetical protein EVG20_g6047 [Dentipellis fragilis]